MNNIKYNIAVIVKEDKVLVFKGKFLDDNSSYILPFSKMNEGLSKKYNFNGESIEDMFDYKINDINFIPHIFDIEEDSLGLVEERWVELKEFDSIDFNPYFKNTINYLKKYLVKKHYIITKDVVSETNVSVETIWEKTCSEIEAYIEFNKALKNDNNVCLFDEMGEMMKQGN